MKRLKILFILLILFPTYVLAYSSKVIPGGESVGININYKGIMVIGFYKIDGKLNKNNLNVGDIIVSVNDKDVHTIDELINYIDETIVDNHVTLKIKRKDNYKNINFELIKVDGKYKTGLYVKDSISGIGTLTYIDPETKIYGALGHQIVDSTVNKKVEIMSGSIFESSITSITRSENGNPGTKNAIFNRNNKYGTIDKNTQYGIYGDIDKNLNEELLDVGEIKDLKLGEAYIYTVLNNKQKEMFKININKIDVNSDIKNIYFEVVDERLLNATGGVVQGMSGSPIIQDNKIYGAVTHVIVDNVKTGYGISIVSMLTEGER